MKRDQQDAAHPDAEPCAYCGNPSNEREHVIARQFFPAVQAYRGDPVLVRACTNCNRAKQRVEDIVGVFLPFAAGSEAARAVIEQRIERTLDKRPHFRQMLQDSFQQQYYVGQNGKFAIRWVFVINDPLREAFREWFAFVVKGLYRSVAGQNLPQGHELTLVWLTRESQVRFWEDWTRRHTGGTLEQRASGEVRFAYALGQDTVSAAFVIQMYGTAVFAVTHQLPDGRARKGLLEMQWT